jgi:uncharacterized protein YndB with AHSA1/START domain
MSSASRENATADDSANYVTASVRIDAAPEVVFPYLTDASLVVRWIGDWAELDPVPGGLFALNIESAVARGTFLVVEPPRRVVFSWGSPGSETMPPGSTTVEITLTADGDETLVELVHRGLPVDEREPHIHGWTTFLGQLRDLTWARP